MKTFKRAYAPEKINYNGNTYTMSSMDLSSTRPEKVIESLKTQGKKAILVEVMNPRLKGVRDLHGNPYKPSKFIYTAI